MKQAPPWKIALPFAAFCGISLAAWLNSRQPVLLLAIAIAFVMGAVWTYGAWHIRRDDERVQKSPLPAPPSRGDGVVISRARRGGFGPLSPAGHLIATEEELLWAPFRQSYATGRRIPLTGDASAVTVARFDEIAGFQSKAGFLSGEALTLEVNGGRRRLRLLDPEGLSNLLAVLPPSGEVDEE